MKQVSATPAAHKQAKLVFSAGGQACWTLIESSEAES
jgi:hypothetical protein